MKPTTRKRSGGKGQRVKSSAGRRTFCTPEVTDAVCEVLEMGGTMEEAAKAVGVNATTPLEWIRKGEAGAEPYAKFAEAVSRARERRPVAILRRLTTYLDYRADDAYLKHLRGIETSRANRRVREAEARLMEAKADAAEAIGKQGGAGLLMLAEDLDLPPALAEAVKAHLASRGIGMLPRVDLVGDVSDDDVAGASPTPMGRE